MDAVLEGGLAREMRTGDVEAARSEKEHFIVFVFLVVFIVMSVLSIDSHAQRIYA
jgi:hypothetical protein